MEAIKILKPGLLTTIQDKGRIGYQQYGMPTAGAMDEFSLRLANILVGNEEYEACLEVTMIGPEILFETSALIAVTGGNLTPKINNKVINLFQSIKVQKGDILSFGELRSGCRSYISVAGGFNIPIVMGSKSTYVRGSIGGYEGRPLKKGDIILLNNKDINSNVITIAVPSTKILKYSNTYTIRVILGPQEDYFKKGAIKTFLDSKYTISNESDRMGYRLSGPKINHCNSADIISDGIVLGSIQVPGHGMPIIMMADRQTTGGYPKIATVISSDIHLLGQAKPGDIINFSAVSINEAHRILADYEASINKIKDEIHKLQTTSVNLKMYKIKVNGKLFQVAVEEL